MYILVLSVICTFLELCAGFHGHDIGQVMEPRLASVLTPRERMGRIGAERLLARIRGEAITPKMLDLGFTLSPGGSI